MFFIILFLSFITRWNAKYYTKVLKTPIYESFKILQFHDIVLLQEKPFQPAYKSSLYNDVYIFEFVPVDNISQIHILVQLFLGKNIPGKIRAFYYSQISYTDIVCCNYYKNPLNIVTYYNNDEIQELLNNWPCEFNAYNHNCQHFSKYIMKHFN